VKNRSAEAAADRLLRKYTVRKPPVPVEVIAKKEGLDVVFHDMEDQVSGLLITNADKPVIAVNVKHHPNRQRFTIAHELGHFVLHQSKPTVFVDEYLVHYRARSEKPDPREMEANVFAAGLLMPRKLVERDILMKGGDLLDEATIRKFAQRFGVSAQALAIRLDQLGVIAAF
jgi:Zn-dependent peptidase ImmA (M78 family)